MNTKNIDIQSLLWSPYQQEYLGCGYLSTNSIHLYNLESRNAERGEPTSVLSSGGNHNSNFMRQRTSSGNSGGGYSSICFGQNESCIFGGTSKGCVRFWDRRSSNKLPQWEVDLRLACDKNLKASAHGGIGGRQHRSKQAHPRAITSLIHRTSFQLYGSTSDGRIMLWDLRKMSTPNFVSRPTPSIVAEYNITDYVRPGYPERSKCQNIVNMELNPSNASEFGFQLGSGWVGTFNVTTSKVRCYRLANPNMLERFDTVVDNIENKPHMNVRFKPTRAARRNCATYMQAGSIFCAALPDTNKIHFVDMSSYKSRLSKDQNFDKFLGVQTNGVPTALAVHPTQNYVVFGTENLHNLSVIGPSSYYN
eukprot:CAMPEP_0204828658 /NCGR_PEP_ID=MMETSP1346-20131115/6531_1 /ASSEMBLY_ACC=CAM_ASM_000771 /TAXON_ID=215587 /ORGANISM="Aplanochytrium stocchinoi, Strain GSBS06" /LENGTH=363 /DNA_ID=CAMNT_0051957897 /DNA_START=1 /DNA_END=1092 /DNA_ORIENTATION=-